jgi:hypothetical protein
MEPRQTSPKAETKGIGYFDILGAILSFCLWLTIVFWGEKLIGYLAHLYVIPAWAVNLLIIPISAMLSLFGIPLLMLRVWEIVSAWRNKKAQKD